MSNCGQSDIPAGPWRYRTRVVSRCSSTLLSRENLLSFIIPFAPFLHLTSSSSSCLDYLRDERITAGPVRSLSLIAALEEDLVAPSARSFGRDEPLLPREAGSAVAGRQVAAACEKRDLQEVPVPARFLLKRAIPPVLTLPDCVLIVVAAPLSYSPHCASLRSGRLLKRPGAAR